MVITTIPAPLPDPNDKNAYITNLYRNILQKVHPLLMQEAAEQTIEETMRDILDKEQVTDYGSLLDYLKKRLRRFALQQSLLKPAPAVSPAGTNPIAHLSPALQDKINKRGEKRAEKLRSSGTAEPAMQNGSYVVLGIDTDTNEKILLFDNERAGSVYVPGVMGAGKSTLLMNMFTQDIQNGHGGLFLDPSGDTIPTILSLLPENRLKDVILIEPGVMANPIGLNLLARTNNATLDFDANRLMGLFKRLWGTGNAQVFWGPRLETVLRSSIYTLLFNAMTLAELPLLLRVKLFREKALNAIPDAERWVPFFFEYDYNKLSEYLQGEHSDSTLNKTYQILSIKEVEYVVSQRHTTIDLRQAMDEKKIILLSLSKHLIGEDAMKFLGTICISELFNAARSRADVSEDKRPLFMLYIDEFQNFLSPLFSQAFAELRKYQIGVVLAHQFLEQLDKETQAVAQAFGTQITFRVNPEDASTLAPFYADEPTVEYKEQEKKLPDSNPFDWLVAGHTHTNPAVNRFADGTLRKIHSALTSTLTTKNEQERRKTIQKDLNSYIYRFMTSADALSLLCERSSLRFLLRLNDYYPFGTYYFGQTVALLPEVKLIEYTASNSYRVDYYAQRHMDTGFANYMEVPFTMPELFAGRDGDDTVDEPMATALIAMIQAFSENQYKQAAAHFASLAIEKLKKRKAAYLAAYEQGYMHIDPTARAFIQYGGVSPARRFLSPDEEVAGWEKEFQRWITEERTACETFIKEFRDFVLALHNSPILKSSGEYEMVEFGRRSVQDMVNDAAQTLVSLKNREAFVKRGASENTPVKIHTLPLLPGCDADELEKRFLQVRKNTLPFGRDKNDLEQELQKRQRDYLRGIVPQPGTIPEEEPDKQASVPSKEAGTKNMVLARRSPAFTPSHTTIITIPETASDADLLTLLSLLPYLSILQIGRVLQKEGSINNSLRPKLKKLVEAKLLEAVQLSRKSQGKSPYLYSLSAKGRNTLPHKPEALTVPSQFLEHTMLCNHLMVASLLLSKQIPEIRLHTLEHELLLKKKPIPLRRSDSLNPDGFVSYTLTPPFGLPGEPVAFCFEIDNNANESETQVREKLEKYLYAATGTYQERFDVNTLTVAFCVPGNTKRVDELVKIAEKVLHQHKEYAPLFLFGSLDFTDLDPITVFTTPQWHTPFTTTLQTLIEKRA